MKLHRQMHTAELLIPESSRFKVNIAIQKLKRYRQPGTDQVAAELIQAGCNALSSEINELINSIWSKKELPQQ